jgi:hypothetical protein
MASIKGGRFQGGTVSVDGNRYENCTFVNCNIEYAGGGLPSFIGCTFDACRLGLTGPASNTIVYLKAIYTGFGEWGKGSVDTLFHEIQEAKVQTPEPMAS